MACPAFVDPGVAFVDPAHSDFVMRKFRAFFNEKDYFEVFLQHFMDVLTACEDPDTMKVVKWCGRKYAMIQTCQMRMEDVLMTMKEPRGMYHLTYSYRAEKEIGHRRKRTFPLFEFEAPAKEDGFQELQDTCRQLFEHLGFKGPFHTITYQKACERYGVVRLTDKEEARLETDFGPVVFLTHFPRDETFFNMKPDLNASLAHKMDVIVGGQETVGSANRAMSVSVMRKAFFASSGGSYHRKLFDEFGRERVLAELERYLSHDFIPRYGGGIGITRVIQAMDKYGLLPEPAMRPTKNE